MSFEFLTQTIFYEIKCYKFEIKYGFYTVLACKNKVTLQSHQAMHNIVIKRIMHLQLSGVGGPNVDSLVLSNQTHPPVVLLQSNISFK